MHRKEIVKKIDAMNNTIEKSSREHGDSNCMTKESVEVFRRESHIRDLIGF